jgi:hypothetical protein
MADELAVLDPAGTALTLLGTPAEWEALLGQVTRRTATSLEIDDGATFDECTGVMHSLWKQAKGTPWHIGDALLEIQRLYPQEYQQLLDPETTPQGQTAANIRSMCRAVPPDLRDPRLTFWQYTPLVPLLRDDREAYRAAGVALIDIAARGGWTRDQIGQAVAEAKRGLEQKHRGRVEKRLTAMAAQEQPVPPTITRVLAAGPNAVLPGSRELGRVLDASLVLPREQAGEIEEATALRMLVRGEDIDRIARAVTLWLQTEAPDEYLQRVLAGRQQHKGTITIAANGQDQNGA